MAHAFRIRFHVEPTHTFASDLNEAAIPNTGVRLLASPEKPFRTSDRLRLAATGYSSEEQARADAQRWFDALLMAQLQIAKGFDLGRFRLSGGLTNAGIALVSAQGQGPVRNDVHGLDVYEDHGERFVAVQADVSTSSALDKFVDCLAAVRRDEPLPGKLRLALELYGVSRFSAVPRIQFLTLISAVEAVVERDQLDDTVCGLVDGWLGTLPTKLKEDESFTGRLRDLKEESISRACRRAIKAVLGDKDAATFKDLYSKRSTLLHDGVVDGTSFTAEAARAEQLVRAFLGRMCASC